MSVQKVLEVKGITKKFGGVVALHNVDLDLYKNEILALVGDNGAGKTTLIKIISGALTPDEGEVFVDDVPVRLDSPADAKKIGIETVYQHLALVESLNVANNIFLGKESIRPVFWGMFNLLKHKKMEEDSMSILKRFGIHIPNIREQVRYLSGGQRQCVAVARAAAFGRMIILLDEPTAALGVNESRHVLDIIQNLKAHDISMIIITHNLEHAFFVADRFFILRLGEKVGTKSKSETNVDEIVKMITGGVFV